MKGKSAQWRVMRAKHGTRQAFIKSFIVVKQKKGFKSLAGV